MADKPEKNDDQQTEDQKLEHKIRRRAYQIWSEEGQPAGHDRDHWIRAKAEVLEAQPKRGAA